MIVFMHDHVNINSEYLDLNLLIEKTRELCGEFSQHALFCYNVEMGTYGIPGYDLLTQMKFNLESMKKYDDIFPETTKKDRDAIIAQFSEYLIFVDSHSTIRYGNGNELMLKVQALPILLEQITNAVEFDYNNHRLELENRLLRVITFAKDQKKRWRLKTVLISKKKSLKGNPGTSASVW